MSWTLKAAHLAARLPILAIIGAQLHLPHVFLDSEASESVILTRIEVKWKRVAAIGRGLMVVIIVLIVLVKFLTRNVPIPEHDDSYLAMARLLRTAVNQVEGRSGASGDELVRNIHEKLETDGVRSGERRADETTRYLDLWEDIDGKFPKGVKYD